VRRGLLALLVGSIAVNAALGIYALLAGDFAGVEEDILYTSLAVSAAGVLSLACLPALERGRLGPLPIVGIVSSVTACVAFVAVIWADGSLDVLERSAGTLAVVAVMLAWSCVVGLARLVPRFRWVTWVAVVLALALAALVALALWGAGDTDEFGRVVGVVAVLLAAFTLLVPLLHRAGRSELARLDAGGALVRFCPACGARVSAEPGTPARCSSCGARFRVELEPPSTRVGS
jgi:hypothetical protein